MRVKSIFNFVLHNKLSSSFGVYFFASVISAALPLLMLPIFTRYLTPTDFGVISIFSVLNAFFGPFLGFSTVGLISREYYNKDITDFALYVGNIFILLFISVVPLLLLTFKFGDFFAHLFNIPEELIWLSIVFSFSTFIINAILIIWQVQSKPIRYGIFQVSQALLNIIISLFLVVCLNLGWEGRIASQIITIVLFALVSIIFIKKSIDLKCAYRKSYLLNAFSVGVPLIPHTLGAFFISMSDRLFLTKMISIESAGIYSLGFAIASIIGFIEQSFNAAFAPWLFEKLSLNIIGVKIKIVKATYVYFIFILMCVFLLNIITSYFFEYFIDRKFEGAQIFIFWISLSFAFSGMYKMVTNYIFYVKKTHILAWITFACAILNIGLNYFFISIYGAVGAAISAALVSFIFFILTWILSNRVYDMPWRLFNKRM